MTNDDKARLRRLIRTRPTMTDQEMARYCDCTVQTVRRYRKALGNA
jgi:DNA-binding transcriptional regulator YiaG